MRKIKVVKSEGLPGWHKVVSALQMEHLALFGQLPGCRVGPHGGTIPSNTLPILHNLGLIEAALEGGEPQASHPDLFPYQQEDVHQIGVHKRFALNHEMGVGKTPPICVALSQVKVGPILIVCPKGVRRVWQDHLDKWWPEHPETLIVALGAKAELAPITITSFDLVKTLPECKWGAIVVDEVHYLKSHKSGRYKAIRKLKNHKDQVRIVATGTPVANAPEDLWAQADILVPGQMGGFWQFKERYMKVRSNAYSMTGKEHYGIREDRAEELRLRLSAFCRRKLKSDPDVRAKLPKISIETVRIKPEKLDVRAMLENFGRADVHRRAVRSKIMMASSSQKIKHVVEMVKEVREGGAPYVSVLTHLKKTAHTLGKKLGGQVITGELTEKARNKILDDLRESGQGILVATMHSLTTGLSLPEYTEVVYAELDYKPHEVAQSMARYHRVSGGEPVRVRVLVLEGTLEERIAESLYKKLADIGMTVGTGVVDGGLEGALEESDDDFFANIQEVAAGMLSGGGYL